MGVTDLLLLSCLGFAITAHAQGCARPAGGPNMHLKDEYILKETFADGDRAVFTCDVGYISAGGSSSITCSAGSWNTVTLTCNRRNCGSPGEVLNGQIHYPQENLFGDHIEITCDEGYRLVGKSTITCGAEGWMGRLPRCEVAICDEAPQVKDATLTPYKDPYNYGDVVRYTCQSGLTLIGSASIECSTDGTFKPDPPTCHRVQCEDLDIPNLVWLSGSRPPHGYKARLTYNCRTGYRIVGQPTLTCDINSQWSPELPRCEVVTCNPPHVVVNGSFSPVKEVYKYGDVVQYSCKTNLRLSGSNSASCSDDGTFKPAPPTCTMVTCNRPPLSEHGSLSPAKDSYTYGDVVQYSCQTGFRLSGSNSASCSDDGTFKPAPPTCTKIPPVPTKKPAIPCVYPFIKHGYLTGVEQPHYRVVVVVKCRWFYYIEGESVLTCEAGGLWSHSPPTCALSGGKVTCVVLLVVVIVAIIIYVILICCGIVPPPFGRKRCQKRLKECGTNDQEGKSLPDGMGLMETGNGDGQTANEKSPVVSSDKV